MFTKHTLHTAVIALIVAVTVVYVMLPKSTRGPEPTPKRQSAFDRVMNTGIIRCGYYVFPPVTYRDPNTGTLSGFSVDFMNRLAERAALKVEWTEEVTFGNWVPAMQAGRFDVVCTPMWPDLPHGKAVLFTHSLFFAGKYPVVRADDKRFSMETTLKDMNRPDVTFVAQEGNMTLNTTKWAVPKASLYILPPDSFPGDYYQSIINGKADAVITDVNSVYEWNKNNPDIKLKLLSLNKPVQIQQFPLVVQHGEQDLRDFLNLGIDEMNYAGEIDHILRNWEPEPGKTYLRVKPPITE